MAPLNPFLHNPHLDGSPFRLDSQGENAVLLFHGFTATCSEVRGLGRILNNAGFATAAPLLPGHGTEPKDLNKVRWQDWTAAAESAYADLCSRYTRVFVGGKSNGALLALFLASEHPEIAGVLAFAPALKLPLTRAQTVQIGLMAPFVASVEKGDLEGDKTWQGYKVNPLKALTRSCTCKLKSTAACPKSPNPCWSCRGGKIKPSTRKAPKPFTKPPAPPTKKSIGWKTPVTACCSALKSTWSTAWRWISSIKPKGCKTNKRNHSPNPLDADPLHPPSPSLARGG